MFLERARVRVAVRWRDGAGGGGADDNGGGGALTGTLRGFDRGRSLLLFDCVWEGAGGGAREAAGAKSGRSKRARLGDSDGEGSTGEVDAGAGAAAPLGPVVILRGEHVVSVERVLDGSDGGGNEGEDEEAGERD